MRPKTSTLKYLVDLVPEMVINEKTILLYLYYCTCGTDSPTRAQIRAGTGLGDATIRRHDTVLEILGVISKIQSKGSRASTVAVLDIPYPTTPLSTSIITRVSSIINVQSQKDIATAKYLRDVVGLDTSVITSTRDRRRGSGRVFSAVEIAADEDYQKAKAILSKYFKEYQINPAALVRKNRFTLLVDLLDSKDFDFEGYCLWYAKNKYLDKGFNFGLFLLDGMRAEYRDWVERDKVVGKYRRTRTSLESSESFRSGVNRTKKFLSKLEDEDES